LRSGPTRPRFQLLVDGRDADKALGEAGTVLTSEAFEEG
jgi:hypothetical protein